MDLVWFLRGRVVWLWNCWSVFKELLQGIKIFQDFPKTIEILWRFWRFLETFKLPASPNLKNIFRSTRKPLGLYYQDHQKSLVSRTTSRISHPPSINHVSRKLSYKFISYIVLNRSNLFILWILLLKYYISFAREQFEVLNFFNLMCLF